METITVKMTPSKEEGWMLSQAYDSKGNKLEGINHASSSEGWARHDMTEFKRERYDELFPNGWEVVFETVPPNKG